MQNLEQLTPMQSTVIYIGNKPTRLIRLTKNVDLLLNFPYFLVRGEKKVLLPRRISNYVLETDTVKLLVTKEELVEAILLAWILMETMPELKNPPCPQE